MNHDMSPVAHLKWMFVAGAGVLGVLAISGVPPARAVSYAALLACPLMMSVMMLMMNRRGQRHDQESHEQDHGGDAMRRPDDVPLDDVDPRWTERRP